ncbi:S9 family peptidase [Brevundimonas sp. AAP58]|uniref:alpha/beta hydrolase family protein n=1 Tax=Brevundimonas sp. AAP58 TaxID=1523422 RepID=UPI000AE02608|nr:CocE/NonD family hydrolase [Brevundimonas sp. AAP58]
MSPHFFIAVVLFLTACSGPSRANSHLIPHPAKLSASVEYFSRQPAGSGPWPTIVFLHGHQNGVSTLGGQAFADWGVLDRYASQGYLSVAVSLPGYGGSDGPRDFAGPYTQQAVTAVLIKLEADGLAEPDRVLLQGVSLGAVTAGLMAADDPGIDGVVLISGLFDLPAFLNRPATAGASAVRAAAMRQTGGDSDALRSRSLLPQASRVKAAALILNGAKDDRTDPNQARRLAYTLNAHGVAAKAVIYEDYGHEIPVSVRQPEIDAFIDLHFPTSR